MEKHDSINNRSEEFREILGEPPSWLLRWGMYAVLTAFIVLLLVGYLFKYPEIVSVPVSLETTNPPVAIAATTMGTIDQKSLIAEETEVTKGTILAYIKDPFGDFDKILSLDSIIKSYKTSYLNVPDFNEIEKWKLGPIQNDLFQFSQLVRGRALPSTANQNQTINAFIENIKKEIIILDSLSKIKQKRLDEIPERTESLKDLYSKSNAGQDHINLQNLYQEKKRLEEEILDLGRQKSEKEREIGEQEFQKSNIQRGVIGDARIKQQNIKTSLNNLENKIEEWKKSHIIEASSNGTLYYQDKLKAKEYLVDKGQRIFAIVPPNAEEDIEGKLYLSTKESAKVEIGQTVKIEFSAFRPSEYGLLKGTIIDKATIPRNGQYLVNVRLDNGMLSTKEKTIRFEHQMLGNAKIITKDRRFINLIFDQFIGMLKRE